MRDAILDAAAVAFVEATAACQVAAVGAAEAELRVDAERGSVLTARRIGAAREGRTDFETCGGGAALAAGSVLGATDAAGALAVLAAELAGLAQHLSSLGRAQSSGGQCAAQGCAERGFQQ